MLGPRLIVFFLLFVCGVGDACPPGSIEYNSICYSFNQKESGFYKAELSCIQAGGHLASIHDAFVNGPLGRKYLFQDWKPMIPCLDCFRRSSRYISPEYRHGFLDWSWKTSSEWKLDLDGWNSGRFHGLETRWTSEYDGCQLCGVIHDWFVLECSSLHQNQTFCLCHNSE